MRRIAMQTAVALLALCFPPLAVGDGEGLTPIQMMQLRTVTEVFPSPDGKQIAFLRAEPRLADDEPDPDYVHLYAIGDEGGSERLLVGGKKTISEVQWSPDGALVTFLDKRDDDKHKQIYALPMAGGEPFRLFAWEGEISNYRWRPDGKAIAFTAGDKPDDDLKKAQEMGFKPVVVDESWLPVSLHLWERENGKFKQLTKGVAVMSCEWSPDSRRLAAAIAPKSLVDDSYMFQRLHLVDPASGAVEKLVDNPGKLGRYDWSPDSARLAYISAADRNDPHAGMLYIVDVNTRQVTPLTDGFEGMVHDLDWSEAGSIRACVSESVETSLLVMDLASKKWTWRTPAGPAFEHMEVISSGAFAAAGSTAEHPAEVFVFKGQWRRLTDSNPWLSKVKLGKQTVETITARDGLTIQGLLLHPLGYEQGKRYPLVIVVHGGPESHFTDGWNTTYARWGQLLSARGCFAWHPNYRASTGRGVAFAKADHGDPMGKEFLDHLDAIAEFDKRGLIDPKRVGIGGGSYGGFTAAWAATKHSEHFAASVSAVPVVDLPTKWYTSDIPYEFFYVHYQEKWPHQQMEFLRSRSPLTYASQCRTPLLLLGGTADTRVHPSQPHMLYRAVKTSTDTPVRYVQYTGEAHGNRINVNKYDFCIRTLRWFDHYLQAGDHRKDPPPPIHVDYSPWAALKKKDAIDEKKEEKK